MMSGISNVFYFILNIIFSLLLYGLWARVLMGYYQTNRFNRVRERLFSITTPIIFPFQPKNQTTRLILPKYDWAAVVTIFFVEMIKFLVLGFILWHAFLPIPSLVVGVIASCIVTPCNLLFYALLLFALFSWIPIHPGFSPFLECLQSLTTPWIHFAQRFIPQLIPGLDFSPLFMMIGLKAIVIFTTTIVPLAGL